MNFSFLDALIVSSHLSSVKLFARIYIFQFIDLNFPSFKVFTLDGKPVLAVSDFAEAEVFIAYGADKTTSEDFELDQLEFK